MSRITLDDMIRVFSVELLPEEPDAPSPIRNYFPRLTDHFRTYLGREIKVATLAASIWGLGRRVDRQSGRFSENLRDLLSVNVISDDDFDVALGRNKVIYLSQSYKKDGNIYHLENVLACGTLGSNYIYGVWTLVPGRRIRIEYEPIGALSQQ